jgi:sirohydrochlorin ferrochelatase
VLAVVALLALALPSLSRLVDILRQRGAPLAFVLLLERPG